MIFEKNVDLGSKSNQQKTFSKIRRRIRILIRQLEVRIRNTVTDWCIDSHDKAVSEGGGSYPFLSAVSC